ncbi:DUF2303 family protein [Paraconexibacter algicola]|uniref:DUF2303 family protein n=1 Tax=Paraconexibacter algicola TaxID=2133960 RepID=A0A2T4UE54_9ACTN|nr:DUF2303 family protein [Paraconexibacter algicola]PTL55780.1 hypothetical protein C7Y72_19315 [Paraconexibacter algicola]
MPDPKYTTLAGAAGDAQAIIDAARELREVRPEPVDVDHTILVRQANGDVEHIDLDHLLPAPRRSTGIYRAGSVDSFIELVRELGDAPTEEHSATTVWVHPTSGTLNAVFDDNAHSETPGWGEHGAVLTLEQTVAWKAWLKHDGDLLSQEDFAEHVEARIPDIADPPAADLQEVIETLTGKTEVSWTSGFRTTDGTVQLAYTEEATATAGRKANMEIPQKFTLVVQPFVGVSDRVPITARFRYRIRPGGSVAMGYVLDQPEQVVEDAIAGIYERLAGTFSRVYMGSPR